MNISNAYYGLRLIRMLNFDPWANLGPISVDISITSICNYHCVFCQTHSKEPLYSNSFQHMPQNMLWDLLSDLRLLKVKNIVFSGNGEPFLNDYLFEILPAFGNCFNITILTNGSKLDLLTSDLFQYLDHLAISLNAGTGESHPVVHGYTSTGNQFGYILHHIHRMLLFPDARKKIMLNYVITPHNINEVNDFKAMCRELGVGYNIRPMSLASGSGRLYHCYNAFIRPFITSSGNVLLCPDTPMIPMGNLVTSEFREVWRSKESIDLRQRHMVMESALSPVCYDCANAILHSRMFHRIYSKIPGVR